MSGRGRSRRAGALLLLGILLGVAGLLAAAGARVAGGKAVSYRPAASVPRPRALAVQLRGAFAVRDFDGEGERLYLLDPLAPAVRVVRFANGQWQAAGVFGRQGGGPGEFSTPTGIAQLPDGRVAVAEPGRIHFFTADGVYLESTAPSLPCPVPLPRVAGSRHGIFLHGSCLRVGGATDTMQMVLFWSPDGRTFREVARDPRFTTDGRFGTAFGADAGYSDGPGEGLFGAGSTACLYRITEPDGVPAAARRCDRDLRRFRLALSPRTRAGIEARRRRSPAAASALRVPAVHPPYVERVVLPSGAAWLRGYSEDSLVLRLVGDSRDLAVLPYQGLIGCRRQGCLWSELGTEGVQVRFIPIAALEALVGPRPRPES
ncbi:MAG: hypothetical protein FIB01_14785 [Gemmatimonadetes bacterium]|nr:hypothetical protein [Gemmatimonadota bacterium]